MKNKIVLDTNSLISYFSHIFNVPKTISKSGLDIIDKAINHSKFNLIIPSIVFVEIFHKWFKDAELAAEIRLEIYELIRGKDNIAILEIDKEVLEKFIIIDNIQFNFDNHDKIILATAMVHNCPLITSDSRIRIYNESNNVIPAIIS
ncbi:PIN domain-containing protein [uncultured Pontibacter sp.]|uniref:type II toxin-antitoxin system VapC family toxin n=1 Tax=uncultured Pontibacter sp. TaxID=453356 RepID=UPI0026100F07|nr:PIN domain-containing protein [uncultured Pontibacter sp.]